MDAPARQLVGVSWVVKRTGLHRSTVQEAAKAGRIPATFLLSTWRFDPDEIERWIATGRNQQATPTPAHRQQRETPPPDPSTLPPLAALFPDAPWRGVNDLPPEQSSRLTARRRAR